MVMLAMIRRAWDAENSHFGSEGAEVKGVVGMVCLLGTGCSIEDTDRLRCRRLGVDGLGTSSIVFEGEVTFLVHRMYG